MKRKRKTCQIKHSICNYASQALWQNAQDFALPRAHTGQQTREEGRRGEQSFSTLSQLIASLFPNKSFEGPRFCFFLKVTPLTHAGPAPA